jgi:hypothetical protein
LYYPSIHPAIHPSIHPYIYLWGWSGTKSTITAAIYWSIVPELDDDDDDDDCEAISELNDWQGKPKYSEKPCLSATLSTIDPT